MAGIVCLLGVAAFLILCLLALRFRDIEWFHPRLHLEKPGQFPSAPLKAMIFHGWVSYRDLQHRCSYSRYPGAVRVLCRKCGQRFVISPRYRDPSKNDPYVFQIRAMIAEGCNNGEHFIKRFGFYAHDEAQLKPQGSDGIGPYNLHPRYRGFSGFSEL